MFTYFFVGILFGDDFIDVLGGIIVLFGQHAEGAFVAVLVFEYREFAGNLIPFVAGLYAFEDGATPAVRERFGLLLDGI